MIDHCLPSLLAGSPPQSQCQMHIIQSALALDKRIEGNPDKKLEAFGIPDWCSMIEREVFLGPSFPAVPQAYGKDT